MYLAGNGDDDIKKYSLSAPYDVTTITLQATTFSISSQTEKSEDFNFHLILQNYTLREMMEVVQVIMLFTNMILIVLVL